MTDITTIIELVLGIISLVVGIVLIPYIRKKYGAENLAMVVKWLEIACNAAEEMARTGLIDKIDKYDYVMEFLETRGITFDELTTQALIKSTVYDLFNRFKEEAEALPPSDEEATE